MENFLGKLNVLLNRTEVNLPDRIARLKAVPLTVGRGILFNCEDEKQLTFLEQWSHEQRLWEKMSLAEWNNSLLGSSVMYLMINENEQDPFKKVKIRVADPSMFHRIARIDEEEQVAEIWDWPENSDSPYIRKIMFTAKEIIIENYGAQKEIEAGSTFAERLDNLGEIKSIQRYPHNFNKLPIVLIKNNNYINIVNKNAYYYGVPDWLPGADLILEYNDEARLYKRKERYTNRSRFTGQLDEMNLIKFKNSPGYNDLLGNDMFINGGEGAYEKGGGQGIVVTQGDPKLTEYNNDLQWLENEIFKSAGYNGVNQNDNNYENKTKTLMENDLDSQTTFLKQTIRLNAMYKLINMVLENAGFNPIENGEQNWSAKFISTNIVDKVQENEIVDQRLANKTISLRDAISQLDGIPSIRADKKLEKILEEQKEHEEVLHPELQKNMDDNATKLGAKKLAKDVM